MMISVQIRVLLIVFSIITAIGILKKIRKSACRISDALYWVGLSLLLILFGVFPQIPIWLSGILGVESPVNLVYLVIIFLLLIKIFELSVKVSLMSHKFETLAIRLAIHEVGEKEEREHNETNRDLMA